MAVVLTVTAAVSSPPLRLQWVNKTSHVQTLLSRHFSELLSNVRKVTIGGSCVGMNFMTSNGGFSDFYSFI
jgi:hypothetical protein